MADDKIIIEFDGNIKQLKAKLKESQREVSKLGKIGAGFDRAITASAGAAAIGIGAITAAIGGAVNEAAKFETITTQFEVLTGSATQAKNIVQELQQFAATTPFQFEGISTAAQQLLGFGFTAEQVVPQLQAIGDVASAVGKPMEEVSFIFGQVAAAGKLTGERLLQFQERAIPIGPAIAKTMGVAEESVRDLVSAGKVDFATFEQAFKSLSEEGGFAFGGMIKQSKTLSGLLSTTGDNISLLASDIGKELLPAAKALAESFLTLLQNVRESDNVINQTVRFWGKVIADAFTEGSEASKKSLDQINSDLQNMGKEVDALEAKIAENRDSPLYNSFLGSAEQDKQRLGNLLAEMTALREAAREKERELEQKREEEKAEKAALEIEQQKEQDALKLEAKLESMSEEEQAILEAETERRAREKEALIAHEAEKEKIEKTRLKNVAQAKRQIAIEDLKAEVKENNLRMKEEIRFGKGVAQAKAIFRSQEYQAANMALNAIISLQQTGNKKLVAIAKAAAIAQAIMNVAQGITNALSFGPILGPPLAAIIGAAGAVQIGTIAGVKFADGGMITGGLAGIDSVPALVQQGEVVAPKKNFEEVIGSVRAKREAEKLGGEGIGGGVMDVVIGFTDDAFEIIEQKIIERRAEGVGLV